MVKARGFGRRKLSEPLRVVRTRAKARARARPMARALLSRGPVLHIPVLDPSIGAPAYNLDRMCSNVGLALGGEDATLVDLELRHEEHRRLRRKTVANEDVEETERKRSLSGAGKVEEDCGEFKW